MMRSMFAALLGVACACMARAQVPGIPDSLLKNSDAVARLMSVDFVYNTPTSASAKFVEETTILNNTATDKGSFTCYVSPTSSLKNFSGTLCDAQGRTLRKFKRSDLKYTEFSGGSLASDIATYYLEVYAPSYPYTVRYEYEMAYKNGLFNFPTFIPVGSKGTALEKGVYTVSVPAGMQFRYKGLHIGAPAKESADGRDIYRWVLKNVPAIKPEPASPPILDLVPLVFAVPEEFEYEKTRGSMRDWASYGAWQCGLLEGRARLPEALRAEVHRRTDGLATDREKVRALYDYLGESTRYVSIQLGIGGQQPATAEEVSRLNSATAKPSPTTCTPCSESAASNRIMPSSTPAAGGCRPISHRPTRPTMPSCAYPSHGIRYGLNVRTPRCRSATYTEKSPGTTQSSSATARANWSRCRSMPTR